MLSDFQQQIVWENWLGAEIRAAYFAELVQRFQRRQRAIVAAGLVLSSGATLALLTTVVPPQFGWIKPTLTLLAAAMSAWSLVAKNERSSIDCADLHFRWNELAVKYQQLWSDMYVADAGEQLRLLQTEELAVSKSSTSQPTDTSLLEKVQANVVMHHARQTA